jgi:hypothetical protein
MRIKITWKDGKKETIDAFFSDEAIEKFRCNLIKGFSNLVIYIGEKKFHTAYSLIQARKIEILED